MSACRSQEGRRASMIGMCCGIFSVLQARTPRGDVPEFCGPYVTCDNRFVRRGRADAAGTGILSEPGRDGPTTRLRIVSVELCGEEHVSPTGAKIVQTELDQLAGDEARGEGGLRCALFVIEHRDCTSSCVFSEKHVQSARLQWLNGYS